MDLKPPFLSFFLRGFAAVYALIRRPLALHDHTRQRDLPVPSLPCRRWSSARPAHMGEFLYLLCKLQTPLTFTATLISTRLSCEVEDQAVFWWDSSDSLSLRRQLSCVEGC
jgi:hypothetical protein